jgi:hypothetical protein
MESDRLLYEKCQGGKIVSGEEDLDLTISELNEAGSLSPFPCTTLFTHLLPSIAPSAWACIIRPIKTINASFMEHPDTISTNGLSESPLDIK